MKQEQTLYKKHGETLLFWKLNYLADTSISFSWGLLGKCLGSRVKDFPSADKALTFYNQFLERIEASYRYKPKLQHYLIQISDVDPATEMVSSLKEAADNILFYNGNGFLRGFTLEGRNLLLPITVVDMNLAFNSIRELIIDLAFDYQSVKFLQDQAPSPFLKTKNHY